tara:strand:- start:19 stop:2736 length:2718 start_codon:yes stop_codon:yes gene_type:complete
MPKQIHKSNEFHGGINENADPRDILNNELAAAENVAVNELGKIRMIGGVTNANGGNAPSDADTVAGYGLFSFSSDFSGANTGTPAVSPTNYLAVADTNDSSKTKIDIAAEGGAFTANKMDTTIVGGSGNASGAMDYYYADGALRVSDTDFSHTANTPMFYKFLGDINRTSDNLDKVNMESSTDPQTISSDWYSIQGTKIEMPGPSSFEPDEAQSTSDNEYIQKGSSGAPLFVMSSAVASDASDASVGVVAPGTLTGASVANLRRVVCNVTINSGEEGFSGQWGYNIKVYQLSGSNTDETAGTEKGSISTQYGRGSTTRTHTINVAAGGAAVAVGSTNSWKIIMTIVQIDNEIEDINLTSATWADSGSDYTSHAASLNLSPLNFHVALDQPGSDVTGAFGWDEDWQVGMSLIYDGNQESLIRTCTQESSSDKKSFNYSQGQRPPSVAIFCFYNTGDGNANKRITGAIMYMKRLLDKQWYPQFELDIEKGSGKSVFSETERPVIASTHGGEDHFIFQFKPEDILEPQLAITYESRTGISHKEKSISSLWKTSCLANRRIYIGNVKTFYEDGTAKIFPDKMVRSLPNKFDIFPLSESVDVAINDGESIVALVEFNDRILQFKERTLYIINASQDMEFLEDKLDYRGISHRASVFKTEYGIVWANKNGCFYFDGKQVNDLLQKDGRPMIKQSTWESFIGTPLVGYDPRRKQIIVVDDISTAKSGDCYIYDMITTSWVKGVGIFPDAIKSNFVVNSDSKLIYHSHDGSSTSILKEWTDSATSNDIDDTSLKILTKDFDFGMPSQKKSVKKAYLTYKGNGSAVTVKYAVNGDTDTFANFYRTTSTGTSDNTNDDPTPLLDVGLDDWVCAELKPVAGSVSCNSFSLEIDGTATDATFEINDMSIVYRPKSIK